MLKYRVKVFVISCDSIEQNKKFAEELKMPFPILADPDRKTAKAFGVDRVFGFLKRHTFIFGPEGKLRFIDKDIKVSTHGSAVLSILDKQDFPLR
jgi:peroxiredoxin Q/BCP